MPDNFNFEQFGAQSTELANAVASSFAEMEEQAQAQAQWEYDRDTAILETERHLEELNARLDRERQDRLTAEQQAAKLLEQQKDCETRRFIINIVVGAISAIAAVVAAVVGVISLTA